MSDRSSPNTRRMMEVFEDMDELSTEVRAQRAAQLAADLLNGVNPRDDESSDDEIRDDEGETYRRANEEEAPGGDTQEGSTFHPLSQIGQGSNHEHTSEDSNSNSNAPFPRPRRDYATLLTAREPLDPKDPYRNTSIEEDQRAARVAEDPRRVKVRDEHGNPVYYDDFKRWDMVSQPESSDDEEDDNKVQVTYEARLALEQTGARVYDR